MNVEWRFVRQHRHRRQRALVPVAGIISDAWSDGLANPES